VKIIVSSSLRPTDLFTEENTVNLAVLLDFFRIKN
jgi:hypothetical protein